jgi:hypothetical protein
MGRETVQHWRLTHTKAQFILWLRLQRSTDWTAQAEEGL